MQHNLDMARLHHLKGIGGYKMKNGKCYNAYMCNDLWYAFVEDMKVKYNRAYNAYKNGSGGELKEKQYPPKMASYGSSSRFVYELSKDIPNFEFEKKRDTRIGGIANIDGYCPMGQTEIYVEAKCREIYVPHSFLVRNCYLNVYNFLKEKCKSFDYLIIEEDNKSNESKISFRYEDEEIRFFDIKQIICHFLGIANELQETHSGSIKFLYLIYNPEELTPTECVTERQISNLINRYKMAINQTECIDLVELFKLICEYLEKDYNKLNFECKIVDQKSYYSEFKL